MASASKRAKRVTAISTAIRANVGAQSGSDNGTSSKAQLLQIPFHTGASLERIPDDVLYEILSHLPTLNEHHVLFGHCYRAPMIPSSGLVRTPTLRALSQTSRLLRSRCLAMAWRSLELCGAKFPKHFVTFYRAIGEATKAATTVLQGCPHLLPLIQTVSVVFTRYQCAKIIPEFAACLATLPNLTTIHVVHAHSQMTTTIKDAFEGIRLPSVRQITLPCAAHAIIQCCPNLEEVTCVQGGGSTVVGSIVRGKCQQLCVLKGVNAPFLKRLIKAAPNLRHIGFFGEGHLDMSSINFPLLNTIEFVTDTDGLMQDKQPDSITDVLLEQASGVLKKSKSQANKTVLVTRWSHVWYFDGCYNLDDPGTGDYPNVCVASMARKAIQL